MRYFSSQQWPAYSPFHTGRLWSCWSWKPRQTLTQTIGSEKAPVQPDSQYQEECMTVCWNLAVRLKIKVYDCHLISILNDLTEVPLIQSDSPLFQQFKKPSVISQVWGAAKSSPGLYHSIRGKINAYVFCCVSNPTLWRPQDRGGRNPSTIISTSCSGARFFFPQALHFVVTFSCSLIVEGSLLAWSSQNASNLVLVVVLFYLLFHVQRFCRSRCQIVSVAGLKAHPKRRGWRFLFVCLGGSARVPSSQGKSPVCRLLFLRGLSQSPSDPW